MNRRDNSHVATVLDWGTKTLAESPRLLRHPVTRILKRDPWQPIMKSEGWIFIHIPKTAGQSTWSVLGCPSDWHSSIDHYFAFDRRAAVNAFKFCVVRNPWDRLVSGFHYAKYNDSNSAATAWREKYLSRCDTLADFTSRLASEQRYRSQVLRYHIFRPQVTYITFEGELVMDEVVGFEQLHDGLTSVMNKLGKPYSPTHVNASNRDDYRTYFRRSSDIDAVRKIYSSDVDLLGYDYE